MLTRRLVTYEDDMSPRQVDTWEQLLSACSLRYWAQAQSFGHQLDRSDLGFVEGDQGDGSVTRAALAFADGGYLLFKHLGT